MEPGRGTPLGKCRDDGDLKSRCSSRRACARPLGDPRRTARRGRGIVAALTLHGPQRRALGQRRGDAVAGAAAVMAIRTAGADAFALSLRVPRVVRQGLTCFARRDLRDHDRRRVLVGRALLAFRSGGHGSALNLRDV